MAIQAEKGGDGLMLHEDLASKQQKVSSGPVKDHALNIPAHADWELRR